MMELWHAAVLGVVEGLTEFLPVSSTGHLILSGKLLGLDQTNALIKAFNIIIQGSAMMAVIALYRKDLSSRTLGALKQKPDDIQFILNIGIAVLPALGLGYLFASKIKQYLFGPKPVIIALVLGGIFLIIYERMHKKNLSPTLKIQEMSPKQALSVGFFQCLALWPGVSRSMSTILGARWIGLSAVDAAYFSFILAIPTLLAATAYDLLKHFHDFQAAGSHFWTLLLTGSLISFVVAYVVMQTFIKFLHKYSLEVFGWYRIALGLVFWLTFL